MCGHSFTWHSVIPPTHCPICGVPLPLPPACPYHPWRPVRPWGPYWQPSIPAGAPFPYSPQPTYYITVNNNANL